MGIECPVVEWLLYLCPAEKTQNDTLTNEADYDFAKKFEKHFDTTLFIDEVKPTLGR